MSNTTPIKYANSKWLSTITAVILFSIIILHGCKPKVETPTDLAGKQALLKSKKEQVAQLKTEIEQLRDEIAEISPEKIRRTVKVTTQKTEIKDFDRYVSIQASVQPDDVVMVSSETGGRLLRVNVKEGQSVRRGQLIASVDLQSLEKQIVELETSLDLAKTIYERQKRLWDQNIGSEIQYLESKNNKERLEKSLETLRHNLSKRNVYSPISGVVNMELLQQGEMASPGLPIVQLLSTSKVKVVADLPESYLGTIKKGDRVSVYFPALDKEIMEKISLIGRTIDPSNRTFKIEIDVKNPKGELKPNLLAEVKVNDFSAKDVITVPIEIIQDDVSGNKFLYVAANSDSLLVAEKVIVQTGESHDGVAIISEGLKAGTSIIIEGARNVSQGDLLEIINQ